MLPVLTVAVVFYSFGISLLSQVYLLPKPLLFLSKWFVPGLSLSYLKEKRKRTKGKKKKKSNLLPFGSFFRHADLHFLKQNEIFCQKSRYLILRPSPSLNLQLIM